MEIKADSLVIIKIMQTAHLAFISPKTQSGLSPFNSYNY